MPESGSEPGIVALQDAVHNASPSDTVLESSPNGDIQSNGAADRERSEKQKEWYVMDIKHVLLPWLVMHA